MALLPAIASPMHGSYVPLGYFSASTTTAGFTFSSIPQNYQDLFLIVQARSDVAGSFLAGISVSVNGGSSTAYFSSTTLQGDGSTASSTRSTTSSPTYGFTYGNTYSAPSAGNTAGVFGVYHFHILNYANSTTYKTALMRGAADINGSGKTLLGAGLWAQTTAISSLSVGVSGNLVAGSTAALYGVRTVNQ